MVVALATPTFSAGLQVDQTIDVTSFGVIGNCDQSFVDSKAAQVVRQLEAFASELACRPAAKEASGFFRREQALATGAKNLRQRAGQHPRTAHFGRDSL